MKHVVKDLTSISEAAKSRCRYHDTPRNWMDSWSVHVPPEPRLPNWHAVRVHYPQQHTGLYRLLKRNLIYLNVDLLHSVTQSLIIEEM